MICTSLQNKDFVQLQALLEQLEMAEIRLDRCALEDEEIGLLFSQTDVPLIATCRLAEESEAPQLLERALRTRSKACMISTGSMSDPYQPCEAELGLTRRCLEIIERYGFGASVITKSDLVLRDIDLFDSINRKSKSVLQMTLTVSDESMSRILEPNVCTGARRYAVLREFQRRRIPTVVWMTPILPFINDTEDNIRKILQECIRVGVKGIICFDMGLTLREGDREYYYAALDRHFPGLKRKYIERYGNAYHVPSPNSEKLMRIFRDICRENRILCTPEECFGYLREWPEKNQQISMFDSD